jgi:ABC-type branched-subunit amino acid transport system ATPase component
VTDLLEVDDLSVSFGGLRAVDSVSLRVREGSIVGLIGPNGAGKTTTFDLISGLTRPTSGTIRFRGREIGSLPAEQRAALGIGRSFQSLGIVQDETVLVNLLAAQFLSSAYGDLDVVFRPWRWRRRERELKERAIKVAASLGLEAAVRQRVGDLSFAQARLVELACVLCEDPALLLLDEPTTGLDLTERRQLLGALRTQRDNGKSILLVGHDVRFVMELCDDIYVLAQGGILFHGDPERAQRDPDVIAAYLGRAA